MNKTEVLLELKDIGKISKMNFEEMPPIYAKAIEYPTPTPTPVMPKYDTPAPAMPFTPVPAPKSDPVK